MSPLTEPTKLVLQKTYVGVDDPDAAAYITLVEAADTAAGSPGGLETATKVAIHSFVKGCKQDGIWPAIKASCILAGARTLSGALVPLAGTAPTNPSNVFVSADYNRKTGLAGDGSTKYLDSNRNNNADPQNNKHLSVYLGQSPSSNAAQFRSLMGIASNVGQVGASIIGIDLTVDAGRYRLNGQVPFVGGSALAVGLKAVSRNSLSEIIVRQDNANIVFASSSEVPESGNLFVFARNLIGGGPDSFANARLAFYSIGESLDLALLDTRVTDLINAFGAAIP